MEILKTVLLILFAIDCIALTAIVLMQEGKALSLYCICSAKRRQQQLFRDGVTVIVLMQEGKSAGLGTIAGMADSYWGQNKGRSMEGALVKSTKFLAILFIVLAAVLNLKVFA